MKKFFVAMLAVMSVLFSFSDVVMAAEEKVEFSCVELSKYKNGEVVKKDGEFMNMKWPFVIMRENGNGLERFYFNEGTKNADLIFKLKEKDSIQLYVSSWGNTYVHCIEKNE